MGRTASHLLRSARASLLLAMAVALLVPGVAMAHAPAGVEEPAPTEIEPILIKDSGGTEEEVTLDTVKDLHGHLCICGAAAFRAASVALAQLYDEDEIPARGDVDVKYYHPGKAHKQVMEHLFGAEHVAIEKLHPQKLNRENFVYEFTRLSTGESYVVRLAEGVMPQEFTDLRYAVNGFENGWHQDEPTQEMKDAFADVYADVFATFLQAADWELYEGIEQPEEPAPVGAIAFSAGLLVLMGVGFIYSAKTKR
jgi:hypothetical protein